MALTRWIERGLYATLIIPILFTPFTAFPWHFGKTVVFQIAIDMLAVLCAIALWRGAFSIPRPTHIDRAVAVFLGWLFVSSLFGLDPAQSFWGNQARASGVWTWMHVGLWYAMLRLSFSQERHWHAATAILLSVGALASLSAVFQNALPSSWVGDSGSKFSGLIGNSAFLGLYLIAVAAAACVSFFSFQRIWGWRRYAAGACAVLFLGTLFYTQSRGAYAGVLAGCAAWIASMIFFSKTRKARVAAAAALGAIALAILGAVLFFTWNSGSGGTPLLPRVAETFNLDALKRGTGETRLLAWGIALSGIREHPLAGWGRGAYEAVFSRHYDPRFFRYGFSETVWDAPHNFFLELGVDAGIIGLAAYLSILAAAGAHSVRRAREGRDAPALSSAFLAGVAAYATALFFLFETTNSLHLFFLFLSYLSVPPESEPRIPRPFGGAVSIACVAALSLFALGMNVRALAASHDLRLAETSGDALLWAGHAERAVGWRVPFRGEIGVFLAEQFVDRMRARVFSPLAPDSERAAARVASALEEEGAAHPHTIAYPLWQGQLCMALGEARSEYFSCAERALARARGLAPRKQDVLLVEARMHALKKNFPAAIEAATAAVAAEPSIGASHWFLGLTVVASGDTASGLGHIEEAERLGFALSREQELYAIDLYAKERRYDIVIERYAALLAKEEDSIEWRVKLATAYALFGDKKTALRLVEEAVALYPPLAPEAEQFIREYRLSP